jgi:hypothetical protein
MKIKKFRKALVLNKQTISNITENMMNNAKGGIISLYPNECNTIFNCETKVPTNCGPTYCARCTLGICGEY